MRHSRLDIPSQWSVIMVGFLPVSKVVDPVGLGSGETVASVLPNQLVAAFVFIAPG